MSESFIAAFASSGGRPIERNDPRSCPVAVQVNQLKAKLDYAITSVPNSPNKSREANANTRESRDTIRRFFIHRILDSQLLISFP